jgi:hypothetical protein
VSARVAELEAQLDALFRAVLAAQQSARYSRGTAMYAIHGARWEAVVRAAGIPTDRGCAACGAEGFPPHGVDSPAEMGVRPCRRAPAPSGCRRPANHCDWPRCGCTPTEATHA